MALDGLGGAGEDPNSEFQSVRMELFVAVMYN